MAESENRSDNRRCPQCGAELPPHVPPDLCPKCLLKAGMGTQPVPGPGGTAALLTAKSKSLALPQAGEKFGHYRIVRLLGEGGMGAAFEADDLESGRRVALKVLSHTLDSPEARERFFREGRLAASINHPNSVYVFGTEEIGGTPVIAMELVRGGTLHELVHAQGPMPVGQAVDAALQIIAGLEAAQRIGILHRDVKPSNCFRDTEGTVKIGDFGLSISTAVRTEPALTSAGEFLGTPAFCSPEQLRGDELNARSDIYSVGATLYYLLTGRAPFEARNVVQLLATVLEQRAPSPRRFRKSIPPGLAKVILRCLEKDPGSRIKNYASLTKALAPYSSTAPRPATLGLRAGAGLIDSLILSLLSVAMLLPDFGDWEDFVKLGHQTSPKTLALMLTGFCVSMLYFAILEGVWGASLGKAICRLRVVRPDRNPPSFLRALVRAVIYLGLPVLPYWVVYGTDPQAFLRGSDMMQFVTASSVYFLVALLFCTARRRNGFAAWQDLATNTRVISLAALQMRPALAAVELPPPAAESTAMVGPYHILETLEKAASGDWLLGYDLRLLRKVWLRRVPSGTQAVPAALRNISRVGRLRWLAGRRSPEENWDAFEAASGKPFINLVQSAQPWSRVRFWLHDLAVEIGAAEKDGTTPAVLALDRVWITADGRAKLLDFPAPGLIPTGTTTAAAWQPQGFLCELAAVALAGSPDNDMTASGEVGVPLPLHARTFLKHLRQLLDADAILAALKPLLTRAAEVSRLRRAAVVMGCLALPAFMCLGLFVGVHLTERWRQNDPALFELNQLLSWRKSMHLVRAFGKKQHSPTDRQFAIYIASHYRNLVTNETTWSGGTMLAMVKGNSRRFVERSVAENASPTEAEIAEAERVIRPYLTRSDKASGIWWPSFALGMAIVTLGGYVGLPALIAALLFRGGLVLRIAGVTFVRKDGLRASRLRVFWRGLVTWVGPGLVILVTWILLGAVHGLKPTLDQSLATYGWALVSALLIGVLTIVSIILPKRGLQDRLAGTWPVPR